MRRKRKFLQKQDRMVNDASSSNFSSLLKSRLSVERCFRAIPSTFLRSRRNCSLKISSPPKWNRCRETDLQDPKISSRYGVINGTILGKCIFGRYRRVPIKKIYVDKIHCFVCPAIHQPALLWGEEPSLYRPYIDPWDERAARQEEDGSSNNE